MPYQTKRVNKAHDRKTSFLRFRCHIAGTKEAVNLRTDIENLSKTYKSCHNYRLDFNKNNWCIDW